MGGTQTKEELLAQELKDPETQDWVCLNLALREATKALAVCVHQRISAFHKYSKRFIGQLPHCPHQNCSQKFQLTQQWCVACREWRRAIVEFCEKDYVDKIVWSKYKSGKWMSNPYEVARVLIPKAHSFYYKSNEFHEDIRFTLSYIENSAAFDVPRDLIQRAWILRNSFKRKGKMKIKDAELEKSIRCLVELLEVPTIFCNKAVPPAVRKLKSLNKDEESGCTIL